MTNLSKDLERHDFELRVIESLEPLSAREGETQPTKKASTPARATTLEDAVHALQTSRGYSAVIERVPQLERPELWGEIAYFDISETRGTAENAPFLWNCDFPGDIWNMLDGYANKLAYFSGQDRLGALAPPSNLGGEVWCYFDAPTTGYYLFQVRLLTYPDDYLPGDYIALVECFIDDHSFGQLEIREGVPLNQLLIASLAGTTDLSRPHQFKIEQITGAFFFESLTVFNIPVVEAAP
jgi:hypothetical protein